MIIDSFTRRMSILTIRGIKKASIIRKLSAVSTVVAHGLIHTLEKAERVYKIMALRGFNGKIILERTYLLNKYDLLLLLISGGLLAVWLI
jgi:energy-coupling factor transporter transmembrane protein EcfT